MFALTVGLVAIALIFYSPAAFLWLALLCFGWITFTVVGPKGLPKVEFQSVSRGAGELLDRYNHAWAAPGMTRKASLAIGVWQIFSIVAVVVSIARSDCLADGLFALAFFPLSIAAGLTIPSLHIKRQGLDEAATKLMHANVENQK